MRVRVFLFLLIFLACEEFDYEGLKVQFVSYKYERCYFSGLGWGYYYTLDYIVIRGNNKYKIGQRVREEFADYRIKKWMIDKRIGRKFYIVRNGVPISYNLYFQ